MIANFKLPEINHEYCLGIWGFVIFIIMYIFVFSVYIQIQYFFYKMYMQSFFEKLLFYAYMYLCYIFIHILFICTYIYICHMYVYVGNFINIMKLFIFLAKKKKKNIVYILVKWKSSLRHEYCKFFLLLFAYYERK